MAPSKPKPTASAGSTSRSKAALATAAAALAKQLSDPKTRAQLIDQGTRIAQLTQTWRAERRAQRESGDAPGSSLDRPGGTPRSVTDRFGSGRLERRLDHLQTSVQGLAAGRPELAAELAQVVANLDQLRFALSVAEGLPLVKRTKARRRIDQELDRLEATIFEASLPAST